MTDDAPTRQLRLRDCADVQTGLAFSRKLEHAAVGTHQVLLGRHVQPGRPYRFQAGDRFLVIPERPPADYLARSDDIVVTARGSQNSAILLRQLASDVPTIVTSTFFRLRARPVVRPGYLAWYLNQHPAQQFIDSARTGTSSPILQKARLLELPVAVPPLPVQQLVQERTEVLTAELELRREALDRTLALHQALHQQLIDQIHRHLYSEGQP